MAVGKIANACEGAIYGFDDELVKVKDIEIWTGQGKILNSKPKLILLVADGSYLMTLVPQSTRTSTSAIPPSETGLIEGTRGGRGLSLS